MADHDEFPNDDNPISVPRKAPKNKQKRADKEQEQIVWLRARDKIKSQAEKFIFEKERVTNNVFALNKGNVDYASSIPRAEFLANEIIRAIDQSKDDLFFLGFDTEGAYDVLQIYAEHGKEKFAAIFQLNNIAPNDVLPPNLRKLLSHQKAVFIGKNAEAELIDLYEKFHLTNAEARSAKYIDTLSLFRFCDVMSRGGPTRPPASVWIRFTLATRTDLSTS